jgi:hypothetical protein
MPRYNGSWRLSTCRCRHRGVRPGRRWTVLWMWLVSYVTAAAVRPLFCFVMAVTGVTMGAASPRLYLGCLMVSGFARIVSRVPRPLHSTFPAGNGARAHGLRAKAGAPFLSFFLSYMLIVYHTHACGTCGLKCQIVR